MKHTATIIIRLVALPFAISLFAIICLRWIVLFTWNWIRNGGEVVTFDVHDRATIREVLDALHDKELVPKSEAKVTIDVDTSEAMRKLKELELRIGALGNALTNANDMVSAVLSVDEEE